MHMRNGPAIAAVCVALSGLAWARAGAGLPRVEGAGIQDTAPRPAPPGMAEAQKLIEAQDWSGAVKALEAITGAEPSNSRAWFLLGYSRHGLGDYEPAIAAYRTAGTNPQVRPLALYNIACARARQGKADEAFAELDLAIAAGFANGGQLASDSDFEAIRKDARFVPAVRRATPIAQLAKELSFWVGEWNVFDPGGTQVGVSRIESVERGCLIIENWSNMTGGTGRSINYVEPATRKWHQTWVDPSGTVVHYDGDLVDGVMRLAGTNTSSQGVVKQARMTLTPQPEGRVRQVIDHSTDGGKTWTLYFDGLYVPKPKPAPEAAK